GVLHRDIAVHVELRLHGAAGPVVRLPRLQALPVEIVRVENEVLRQELPEPGDRDRGAVRGFDDGPDLAGKPGGVGGHYSAAFPSSACAAAFASFAVTGCQVASGQRIGSGLSSV